MSQKKWHAAWRREINNSPWMDLQHAIVEQAALDYSEALKELKRAKTDEDKRSARGKCSALVRWFNSPWGQALSYGNGDYIVRKIKEKVLEGGAEDG